MARCCTLLLLVSSGGRVLRSAGAALPHHTAWRLATDAMLHVQQQGDALPRNLTRARRHYQQLRHRARFCASENVVLSRQDRWGVSLQQRRPWSLAPGASCAAPAPMHIIDACMHACMHACPRPEGA